MSKINDLLVEIEDLNKKIEEEPQKKLKRKVLIDDEIENLEEEKRKAGLKGDFSSVTMYNSKIKLLEQEKSTDYVLEYNEKIKCIKEEITKLIVDYYQEGYIIDDIFIKEDISLHIQKEWLDKGDFGKNTGYLFVDEIKNDENYNWRYINPITNFEVKSIYLNDLKTKINNLNKIFFIFDNDLAEKSKNNDLIIIKKYIEDLILKLNDDESDKDDVFQSLKEISDKFSIDQITRLSEFFMEDIENYSYFDNFNYILEHFEGDFDNVYENLIDNALNNLDDLDYYVERDIFRFFTKCAGKFNKNQILKLQNYVIENIDNFNEVNNFFYDKYNFAEDFNYILNCNKYKFGEEFIDNIYFNLIENGINKLKDNSGDVSAIFNYLKSFSINFSKNQLIDLSDIVRENNRIFSFARDYKCILETNDESVSQSVYSKIINNKIELISTLSDISGPINDLYYFSEDLDKKQFNRLCNIIVNNGEINNFARDFKKIIEAVDFNIDGDEIYNDLIDNRIEFLTKNDANEISGDLFLDLLEFADKFNRMQIKTFYQICKQNELLDSFEYSILAILSKNEKQLDDNFKLELYRMKIDSKLNELDKLGFGYSEARNILESLENYSSYFSIQQLDRLCRISITNNQVYDCFICTNALRNIISKNKDKINSELYQEVVLKNNL